ncbi:lipopolysaccharide-induced tumor necrosis factor-alpha factor homolog [Haematobia irritans]|uniref:lipopolysaccharide-induced tumor necrosis factor-alpha factor homolog n=1 Tax=Haematobia irritans TaxID=7368 RepID=UPI003F4F6415
MDQKHAMLYPDATVMPNEQRSSAAAAIGLPVEAPPSYDVATRAPMPSVMQQNIGWSPNAGPMHMGQSSSGRDGDYPNLTQHHNVPVTIDQYPSAPVITNQPSFIPRETHESTVVTVQPTPPTLSSQLGPNPSKVTCPACGASRTTRMAYTPNSRTHLCAFILCIVGGCCCACIVPYCMKSCRTGNHYCAKCNAFLGTYNTKTNLF